MEKEILLKNITVKDIHNLLIDNPSVLSPDAHINELLLKMIKDLRVRHVYVVDNCNKLIGSVRMNTVVQYLFPVTAITSGANENQNQLYETNFKPPTVSEIMNRKPYYVLESTNLSEMAAIFMKEKINELPVVDKDMKLVGQVNVYEVITAYLEKKGEFLISPYSLLHLIE